MGTPRWVVLFEVKQISKFHFAKLWGTRVGIARARVWLSQNKREKGSEHMVVPVRADPSTGARRRFRKVEKKKIGAEILKMF